MKTGAMLAAVGLLFVLNVAAEEKRNILHIIIDDLRPELPPYENSDYYPGSDHILAPNIAKLANKSTLFERAYCQYAMCGPSRTSFLTGRRPTTLEIFSSHDYFRDTHPGIVTIPMFFKNNGYTTLGTGKVFHPPGREAVVSFDKFYPPDKAAHRNYRHVGDVWMAVSDDPEHRVNLPDEIARDQAVDMLKEFAANHHGEQNFYMAVGFRKPHLPWVAPQRFFDLYDIANITLPENKKAPQNMPNVAWPSGTNCLEIMHELKNETTAERIIGGNISLTLPDDLAVQYQRGYYACISFVDSLVGELLDTLEDLGLHEDTVIVLHSDHGFNLGENSAWGKHTQFETANHVPLMFHLPGETEAKVFGGFVELLDVFPTLVELAGFPSSDVPRCSDVAENLCHEGISLAPIIKGEEQNSSSEFADYVNLHYVGAPDKGTYFGESVLSKEGRFTRWYLQPAGFEKKATVSTDNLFTEELYDHTTDKKETVNVAGDQSYADLRTHISSLLQNSN